MIKKDYVRDGKQRIMASLTTGFSDTSAVVRNQDNRINGRRTSERFHTTRDGQGKLVSVNSANPGLLVGRGKQR